MVNLSTAKWIEVIKKAALDDKMPLLGICLGMQLLTSYSEESGSKQKGLDLISGKVEKFHNAELRVPHVDWNEVMQCHAAPLFDGIANKKDFYFVHSYYFSPADPGMVIATTPYGRNFASVIQWQNIYGVQFHPEKSLQLGQQLLRNFLSL